MTSHRSPLAREISRSVVSIAVASVLVTNMIGYLCYGIMMRLAPGLIHFSPSAWFPSGVEWAIIATLTVVAAMLAAVASRGLARRILGPVVSVAETTRRVKDGDLAARASPGEGGLLELTILVDDFNSLAQRLELASQAVTQSNAAIAHELRTPVTILRGRIQGLADGVFKPEPALLRSLETQIVALSRLIDDLRTVTLFDGGRLSTELVDTDLAECVRSTLQYMQPELERAGFVVESALDTIRCSVDGARICQALVALLDNARRHAHPGPVRVSLGCVGGDVRVSVHDNGPGLAPEFERHAFDPYERFIDQGGLFQGSGLGLSVVRAIAEVHGGSAIYKTIDGGACFTLAFPFRIRSTFALSEETGRDAVAEG